VGVEHALYLGALDAGLTKVKESTLFIEIKRKPAQPVRSLYLLRDIANTSSSTHLFHILMNKGSQERPELVYGLSR